MKVYTSDYSPLPIRELNKLLNKEIKKLKNKNNFKVAWNGLKYTPNELIEKIRTLTNLAYKENSDPWGKVTWKDEAIQCARERDEILNAKDKMIENLNFELKSSKNITCALNKEIETLKGIKTYRVEFDAFNSENIKASNFYENESFTIFVGHEKEEIHRVKTYLIQSISVLQYDK